MPRQNRKTITRNSKLGFTCKSIDLFGGGVGFTIGGSSTHKSCFGAVLTLAIIVVTLSYAVNRAQTMAEFGDTVHQTTEEASNISMVNPMRLAETGMMFGVTLIDKSTYVPVSEAEMKGIGDITLETFEWDATGEN